MYINPRLKSRNEWPKQKIQNIYAKLELDICVDKVQTIFQLRRDEHQPRIDHVSYSFPPEVGKG